MGQKKLAILMAYHMNKGFLQENAWPFCRMARKSGRNDEVTVRKGFTISQKIT